MRHLSRFFSFLGTHPVIGGIVALATLVGTALGLVSALGVFGAEDQPLKTPIIAVDVGARHEGAGAEGWRGGLAARPGERIEILIAIRNIGNGRATGVEVHLALDSTGDLRYVDGSCQQTVGGSRTERCSDAEIIGSGLRYDSLGPHRTIYIRTTVGIKLSASGTYSFDAIGDSDETREDIDRGELSVRREP